MATQRDSGRTHTGKDALDRWAEQARRSGDESGEDEDSGAPDSADDEKDGKKDRKSPFANIWVKIAIVVVVVLLVAGGIIWWLIARQYEDTDDAFVDTHIVHVSPQIAGQILAIHVNDNQTVRAGQPLVDIDARPQMAQLEQALAQRLQATTQIAQAQANTRAADAQVTNTSRDLARYRQLQATAPAAVAQQQVDQAVAANRSAIAQRDGAAAQIATAQAQIKVLDAQIATAKLNLSYAHIVSPVNGHVTQRSVALGNYVSPGQELMALVPQQLWVTANFKETQLRLMRRGQHVAVTVDSCDKTIGGHVDSIQRGAGQAFGILPPENATGNYVKVVQRVPVKILLDNIPQGCVLGPGMSVEPSVTVR
ncbi:MAG TPA: HlyD family secretion protein [Rhizomicrobium sp.]|nr:HlyD family secretion protein [Rhizomicrobium sp.]